MELYQQIEAKIADLEVSVKKLRTTGTAFAQAEKDYKVVLSQEALKLRDDGMPVTLIDKVIYGVPKVADARFDRDVKEAVYNANREAINSIKLQIRILQDQLNQEWGAVKYD